MRFKLINPVGADNHGHKISQEQENFFKHSIVRDNKGNLLACFHGTHYFGFSDFDPAGMDRGFSWFTPDYGYAYAYVYEDDYDEQESGVYRCYLNITNPFIIGDVEKPISNNDDAFRQLEYKELPEEGFSNEFKELAKKVKMTPHDLVCAIKYIDDDLIYAITRSKEFADIILKLGYDGLVTKEYKGKSDCYAVPYTMPFNIKKCNNYKPTKSRYIDEDALLISDK